MTISEFKTERGISGKLRFKFGGRKDNVVWASFTDEDKGVRYTTPKDTLDDIIRYNELTYTSKGTYTYQSGDHAGEEYELIMLNCPVVGEF